MQTPDLKTTCSAMFLSLVVGSAIGHAEEYPMEIVAPPDGHARTHAAAVRHLSKPASTYAANCAGCHGPSGRTVSEIPTLVDRIGYFARIPEGREYLVQVPGVAMSAVGDEELAEMLNWLLNTYSAAQLPRDFKPYTRAEVGELRKVTVIPWVRRGELIQSLLARGKIASAAALE